MKFPYYKQQDQADCGPTCLRMLGSFYGCKMSIQKLRALCHVNRGGSTLLGISEAAEKIGFRTTGVRLGLAELKEAELPCLLHWRQNHYVVLYKISKVSKSPLLRRGQGEVYHIADPATGLLKLSEQDFLKNWHSHPEAATGIALLLAQPQHFTSQTKMIKLIRFPGSPSCNIFMRISGCLCNSSSGWA